MKTLWVSYYQTIESSYPEYTHTVVNGCEMDVLKETSKSIYLESLLGNKFRLDKKTMKLYEGKQFCCDVKSWMEL